MRKFFPSAKNTFNLLIEKKKIQQEIDKYFIGIERQRKGSKKIKKGNRVNDRKRKYIKEFRVQGR